MDKNKNIDISHYTIPIKNLVQDLRMKTLVHKFEQMREHPDSDIRSKPLSDCDIAILMFDIN